MPRCLGAIEVGQASWTALHHAAHNGEESVVKGLLHEQPELVEALTSARVTALHLAAAKGYVNVVEMLLAAKPKTNFTSYNPRYPPGKVEMIDATDGIDGFTALHYAAFGGHVKVVDLILAARPNLYPPVAKATPMHLAAEGGHTKIVELLLDAHCSADSQDDCGRSPLSIATYRGYLDVVELLLSNNIYVRVSELEAAVLSGHFKAVEMLLAAKPKLADEAGIVLHGAAAQGIDKVVELLLGLNPALTSIVAHKSRRNAVHFAAEGCSVGHDRAMELLLAVDPKLAQGVDVGGYSTLHVAARSGSEKQLEMLLAVNPSLLSLLDGNDWTPLDHSAAMGKLENARMLLLAENARVPAVERKELGTAATELIGDATERPRKYMESDYEAQHMFGRKRRPRRRNDDDDDDDDDDDMNPEWEHTTLHIAVANRHEAIAELLLTHRPEMVNVVNNLGFTVLHFASRCSMEFAEKVRLLNPGAFYAKNREGHIPFNYSSYSCSRELSELWRGRLSVDELADSHERNLAELVKAFVFEPLSAHLLPCLATLTQELLVNVEEATKQKPKKPKLTSLGD